MNDDSSIIPAGGNDLAAPAEFDARTNPAVAYLASLSAGSRRTMTHALNLIAGLMGYEQWDITPADQSKTGREQKRNYGYLLVDWATLRAADTGLIRSWLQERVNQGDMTAGGANKNLAALRGVLKHAWRNGLMPSEEYQRAADLAPIKGSSPVKGRDIEPVEIKRMIDAALADENTRKGQRDAAIIAVMHCTGARRSSVVKINIEDINWKKRRITLRAAKGNKTYDVALNQGALAALRDWLAVLDEKSGPLFRPVNKRGGVTNRALSTEAIYAVIAERAAEAGLDESPTPHDLRRTLAGDLLDAGVDLVTVKDILGHANIETTVRYDRRGEQRKADAIDLIDTPYGGRSE